MGYLSSLLVYVALFFLPAALRKQEIPLCTWLLNGLTRYAIYSPGKDSKDIDAKKKKQGSKQRKPDVIADGLHGMDQPVAQEIILTEVVALPYFDKFSGVCDQTMLIMLQWVGSELMSRFGERVSSPLLATLAIVVLLYTSFTLLSLQLHNVINVRGQSATAEQQIVASVMAALALVLVAFVVLAPTWLVDIRIDDGAAGLQEAGEFLAGRLAQIYSRLWGEDGVAGQQTEDAVTAAELLGETTGSRAHADAFDSDFEGTAADLLEALQDGTQPPPAPQSSALMLAFSLGVAALAGVHGGMILLPVVRLARSVRGCLHPPRWSWRADGGETPSGLSALDQGPLGRALAALTTLAPAAALLLWVKPVAEDMLGLGDEPRIMLQGVALVIVGLLQLVAFRPVMQAYLNSGFVHWYLHKHSIVPGASSTKDLAVNATSAYTVINNTFSLAARVATQLVAVPVITLLLGCLVCDSVALGRVEPELEDDDVAFQGAVLALLTPPRKLVWAACSFLGMTALLMQTLYSLATLALYRNGVLNHL